MCLQNLPRRDFECEGSPMSACTQAARGQAVPRQRGVLPGPRLLPCPVLDPGMAALSR